MDVRAPDAPVFDFVLGGDGVPEADPRAAVEAFVGLLVEVGGAVGVGWDGGFRDEALGVGGGTVFELDALGEGEGGGGGEGAKEEEGGWFGRWHFRRDGGRDGRWKGLDVWEVGKRFVSKGDLFELRLGGHHEGMIVDCCHLRRGTAREVKKVVLAPF